MFQRGYCAAVGGLKALRACAVAGLKSGDVDRYILGVLAGPARLIAELGCAAAARAVARWWR